MRSGSPTFASRRVPAPMLAVRVDIPTRCRAPRVEGASHCDHHHPPREGLWFRLAAGESCLILMVDDTATSILLVLLRFISCSQALSRLCSESCFGACTSFSSNQYTAHSPTRTDTSSLQLTWNPCTSPSSTRPVYISHLPTCAARQPQNSTRTRFQ